MSTLSQFFGGSGGSADPLGSLNNQFLFSDPALMEANGDYYVRTGSTILGADRTTLSNIAAKSTEFLCPSGYHLLNLNQSAYTNIISGNSILVSMSNAGGILRSTDGINWQAVDIYSERVAPRANINSFSNMVFFNGKFHVAVQPNVINGRSAIHVFSSADAITWDFVTVSMGATIVQIGTASQFPVLSIAGGSLFIGAKIRDDGALAHLDIIFRSEDGVKWKAVFIDSSATVSHERALAIVKGTSAVWTAVPVGAGAATDTGRVFYSTDGNNWTASGIGTPLTSNARAIKFLNEQFIAITNAFGSTSGQVYTSPTGQTWTARTSASTNQYYDVEYAAGLYVMVGNSGAIQTSPDGITWTSRTSGTTATLNAIYYDTTLSLFVINTNTTSVLTSPDGITWTSRTVPTAGKSFNVIPALNNVFHRFDGKLYFVGNRECIMSTTDGVTWSMVLNLNSVGTTSSVWSKNDSSVNAARCISEANGKLWYMPATAGGIVSIDLQNGNVLRQANSSATVFNSVAWGNGVYVAVGASGAIQTSADGLSWVSRTSGTGTNLTGVVFNGTAFVAVSSSYAAYSADGISWTNLSISGAQGLATSNGQFFISRTTSVLISDTGQVGSWVTHNIPSVSATVAIKAVAGGAVLTMTPDRIVFIDAGARLISNTFTSASTSYILEHDNVLYIGRTSDRTLLYADYPYVSFTTVDHNVTSINSSEVSTRNGLSNINDGPDALFGLGNKTVFGYRSNQVISNFGSSTFVGAHNGLQPLAGVNSIFDSTEYVCAISSGGELAISLKSAILSSSVRINPTVTVPANGSTSTFSYSTYYRKIT